MSVGKLKITIVSEIDVDDLEQYEAETLEQAAENATKYIKEGYNSIVDYIDFDAANFNIEAVKE
jgi:hypothetical protein